MKGLVQIYTGNGKGKTTAAIGQAVRALGHGKKIYMLQFMKGSSKYGEIQAVQKYCPDFIIDQSGLDTFVSKEDPSKLDLELALLGLKKARQALTGEDYDLVILDEINVAVDFKLISLGDVIKLLQLRPKHKDLILTGRYCPKELYGYADLVSEIMEIKHHYQIGAEAREGIEF